MKKKTSGRRKKLYGLGGAVCIAGYFAVLVLLSLRFFNHSITSSAVITDIVCCVVILFCMNYLNRLYDTAEGYASVHSRFGSWARNSLFWGLIYLYGCTFVKTVSRFYDAEVLSQAATVEGIMLIGVGLAIVLHVHNEKYLGSRKARIRRLERRGLLNDGRRYSLVVENSQLDKKTGVMVFGQVFGEVHRGDRIYIYKNGSVRKMARVRGIYIDEKKVKKAKDIACVLVLGDELGESPGRLAVISGIRESHESAVENNVENPVLRAYLHEYSTRFRDPIFFYQLINAMIHSYYLVPGFYPDGNKRRKDIMDRMESTRVTFPSVNNKDYPKDAILAIFTDWNSLKRWGDMMAASFSSTTVMDFKQVMSIETFGYKGIVINPFGPVPFYLNSELIDRILAMPEYKETVRNKKASASKENV